METELCTKDSEISDLVQTTNKHSLICLGKMKCVKRKSRTRNSIGSLISQLTDVNVKLEEYSIKMNEKDT